MKIDAIIANTMDLAGGELVRRELTSHAITLHVLNVIDTMMQELGVQSPKSFRSVKSTQTLTAGVQEGTFTLSSAQFEPHFVRYKETTGDVWRMLPQATDVEDLTRAQNEFRYAILFTNVSPPDFAYQISFEPATDLSIEIWNKQRFGEPGNLDALPPFPEDASLLCAYRAAMFSLNELLLKDARRFQAFVNAQRATIYEEKKRLQHIWDVFRTTPADRRSVMTTRNYNAIQDFTDEELNDHLSLVPPITQ